MGSFGGDPINLAISRKSKIEIFSSFLSTNRIAFIERLPTRLEHVAIRQFAFLIKIRKLLMVNYLENRHRDFKAIPPKCGSFR